MLTKTALLGLLYLTGLTVLRQHHKGYTIQVFLHQFVFSSGYAWDVYVKRKRTPTIEAALREPFGVVESGFMVVVLLQIYSQSRWTTDEIANNHRFYALLCGKDKSNGQCT